jgi:hypothetical protein
MSKLVFANATIIANSTILDQGMCFNETFMYMLLQLFLNLIKIKKIYIVYYLNNLDKYLHVTNEKERKLHLFNT